MHGALACVVFLVTATAMASADLWTRRPLQFLDRIMLAVAAGVLLWLVARVPPRARVEDFQACSAEPPPAEDTSDIDGLRAKLYASVFGPSPVTDGNWGRLHINQERTSNTADQTSADVAAQGLNLYNRSLHGPQVDQLGLSTTDRFTWAIAARFNNFDEFASTDLTSDTLAQMETSTAGPDYIFKLDLTPGDQVEGTSGTRVRFNMAAGAVNASSPQGASPVFDPEMPYLIVINRNGRVLGVRRYPLISTATTGQLGGAEAILTASDVAQGMAPSNQKVLFNVAGRFNMSAYAVALFDSSLSETQEVQLQQYFEKRIREAMDPAARQPGDCPYGPDVCGNHYCAGISDWSKPELIIDSRAECKTAIDAYCKENPSHPSCYCWNKEDQRHGGEDCLRWRAFIGAGECKALDSLTDADLEKVKKLYNLQKVQCKEKDTKPKTGIINPYDGKKVDGGDKDKDGDDDDDDGKPNIRNYYKVPGRQDDDHDGGSSVANPYESIDDRDATYDRHRGSPISDPYQSLASNHYHWDRPHHQHHHHRGDRPHHHRGSVSNPYLSSNDHDKNRLLPMHNLDFHDKWGDKHDRPSAGNAEEAKPSGLWQSIRSFVVGD